jgi:hypothetical protein
MKNPGNDTKPASAAKVNPPELRTKSCTCNPCTCSPNCTCG